MRLADDKAEGRLVGEAERQGGRGRMAVVVPAADGIGESADGRSWSCRDYTERDGAGSPEGSPWRRILERETV